MILEDSYNLYLKEANNIKNWKQIDKNKLCNLFIDNEFNFPYNNYYFSAILCKYWPKIQKLYQASSFVAQPEDCYEWLVEAIQYALSKRKWKDPDNKLASDPNAPDKVINRKVKHIRLNFLCASNRYKRQANINNVSIDQLEDDYEDAYQPAISDEAKQNQIQIDQLVIDQFRKKEYEISFIVDAIINSNCFTLKDNHYQFNKKRLVKHIKSIKDKNYLTFFSQRYNIDQASVDRAFKYVEQLNDFNLHQKIDKSLFLLKKKYKEYLL